MEKKHRGSFTGGLGFVLAAAGSAVGLGNLWRFPYLAAQYGGGIFILVYIILALTFGFTLMTTEIAIGRKTKLSPTRAYAKVHKKFGFIGPIAFIIPVIILPYYCVIGGWVTKYMAVFISGQNEAAAETSFFSNFISQEYAPLIFFFIFLALTALIVVCGVEKGIENVSRVLMPVNHSCSCYLHLRCITAGFCRRIKILPVTGFFKVFIENRLCRNGADVLFHEPCNGHYDYVWFLHT